MKDYELDSDRYKKILSSILAWFICSLGVGFMAYDSYVEHVDSFKPLLYIAILFFCFALILVASLLYSFTQKNRKSKLFDQLLADHILSSLLADKKVIKEWSLFQKTVLLRIKELVDDGQIYKFSIYDEFISELVEYKNDKEKEIIEQEVEMEVKENNIRKEQLENEKATDLLSKYKKSKNT